MMSAFRVSDVLKCILLHAPKGPNLACPKETFTRSNPLRHSALWKETLANRGDRVTLNWWEGLQLGGLASAHIRRGRRAWEIDRFFLAQHPSLISANGDGQHLVPSTVALNLFEHLGEAVGGHGAERLFLRLPSESPISVLARRAGFFPYFEEMLLEGPAPRSLGTTPTVPSIWGELLPEDYHGLFQLYCAATPQAVRAAAGLTFDQWRDAQESWGRRSDWVAKNNGRVVGWLGFSELNGVTGVEALANPDEAGMWEAIVTRALTQQSAQRWLVPDYHEEVADQLLRRQYHEVARYTVMIKTVAVPVASQGMATVEA
jgi:hypothetical protein